MTKIVVFFMALALPSMALADSSGFKRNPDPPAYVPIPVPDPSKLTDAHAENLAMKKATWPHFQRLCNKRNVTCSFDDATGEVTFTK